MKFLGLSLTCRLGAWVLTVPNRWSMSVQLEPHGKCWEHIRDPNWPDKLGREMTMHSWKALWAVSVVLVRATGKKAAVETRVAWNRYWKRTTKKVQHD